MLHQPFGPTKKHRQTNAPVTVSTSDVKKIEIQMEDAETDGWYHEPEEVDLSGINPSNGYSMATSVGALGSDARGRDEPIHVDGWSGSHHVIGSPFADCIKTGFWAGRLHHKSLSH